MFYSIYPTLQSIIENLNLEGKPTLKLVYFYCHDNFSCKCAPIFLMTKAKAKRPNEVMENFTENSGYTSKVEGN